MLLNCLVTAATESGVYWWCTVGLEENFEQTPVAATNWVIEKTNIFDGPFRLM